MISVIVPVYNVEKYLAKCIQSIQKQTYTELEIILVDDGSTDKSGQICEEYAGMDARIKVIHKANGGLSEARNYGIDAAKGGHLVFVDSDDYIHPDMIKTLFDAIQNTGSDIAVCDFREVEENDILKYAKVELSDSQVHVYQGQEKLNQLYTHNLITVVAWNKIYAREVFGDIRYPVGKLHEDEYVIHELLFRADKVVYVDEKMYYYLQRGSSITGNISIKNIRDGYDALQARQKFWIDMGQTSAYEQNLVNQMYFAVGHYFKAKEQFPDKALLKAMQKNIGTKINTKEVQQWLSKEKYMDFWIFQKSPVIYQWYIKKRDGNKYSYKLIRRLFNMIKA